MIPADVMEEAIAMGYSGADQFVLSSGEKVYILDAGGAVVGVPMYLHYDGDMLIPSTLDESVALRRELRGHGAD